MAQFLGFGSGEDELLTISGNTTESPIDSACIGTINTTSLSATNASFETGQLILIHQTRGTGAGQWELNQIYDYVVGTITTARPLTYGYASGAQVRVLKQYSSVQINSLITYTAKAWNGTVGGILAFLCNGLVNIEGTVTATGKGFRGGPNVSTGGYTYQGEGTTGAYGLSRNANGNGGGGGGPRCSGGTGGHVGVGLIGLQGTAGDYRGYGAGSAGSADLTNMVFGGGGGAGGNSTWGVSELRGGSGGNGGGIVLIMGARVNLTGAIVANGNNGGNRVGSDGAGGSCGAGGSVFIKGETAVLGTTKIVAIGGQTGGAGDAGGANGRAPASNGIVRVEGCSISGTSSPSFSPSLGGHDFCGELSQVL